MADANAGTPSRGRLLIVDDDRMQRLIMATVARRTGFVVDEAASLQDVRALMGERVYRAALVDLSLGDGDGIEVIRHIAGTGQRPGLIVISGFDGRIREGASRFGRGLGLASVGTLRKPIDVGELRLALLAVPDNHATRQPAAARSVDRDIFAAALEQGEVVPFYQPKVALASREIVGVEALARWVVPSGDVISPDAFIPHIAQWNLSRELTHAMLQRACADAAQWPEHVGFAVNVPAEALTDVSFPDFVRQTLLQRGISPQRLTVEITESTALSDDMVTADVLTRLRIRGIHLSLDDFGTGYSSLSSLLGMPFSELKIDRSFVGACERDRYAWKIVRATLSLAREFGMSAVAEGVESEAVAAMLAGAGCETAQGYLFSRAVPAAAMDAMLRGQSWRAGRAPARLALG